MTCLTLSFRNTNGCRNNVRVTCLNYAEIKKKAEILFLQETVNNSQWHSEEKRWAFFLAMALMQVLRWRFCS